MYHTQYISESSPAWPPGTPATTLYAAHLEGGHMGRPDTGDIESSLRSEAVRSTLQRLHSAAAGDWKKFIGITPRWLAGLATGKKMHETITPAVARDIYMPVSPDKGEFLYITARAIGARNIVAFGPSF
ncbi:MAG: hypothetical protein FJ170_08430, partial [Gammaproteobacteria bacterium]|nr:hypothetical protein [Gammaproteobacteria bacterium]